jgi:hypothetical protein
MRKIIISLTILLFSTLGALAGVGPIPPTRTSAPKPVAGLDYGTAYGSVSFNIQRISAPNQNTWLSQILANFFGVASTGEYILAIELIDQNSKLIARQMIAHFVKNPKGQLLSDVLPFLFTPSQSNNTVQDSAAIVFSGDVSPRLPINADTNNYSVVLQLYHSSSTSLTNSGIILNAIDTINSATNIINFSPISAGEKAIYQQLLQLGVNIYQAVAQSPPTVIASQTKMSFIAKDANPAPNVVHFSFPYEFDKPISGSNIVDVAVTFNTFPSILTTNFKSGKFTPPLNWSQWLAQGTVSGQTLPQFFATNDSTKAFFAAVDGGTATLKKFAANSPIDRGCDLLVSSLTQNQYFSSPDVGALYWSFLNQYWTTLLSADQTQGKNCQDKYASIYFDPYSLPHLQATAGPIVVLAPVANAPPLTGSGATLKEAIKQFGGTSTRLRAFQGVVLAPE